MHAGAEQLRREVAELAARLIADSGLDYGNAKSRAIRQVCGARAPRGATPDNLEIDAALREHLDLFDDGHAARIARMRRIALDLMKRLADFHPLVTGAAWKGIAAEHAPVHLQLFHDNPKEVEYWLLDRRIDFEVGTTPHFRGQDEVEAIGFYWEDQPVMLTLYAPNDLRGALKGGADGPDRGNRIALLARMKPDDPSAAEVGA
ncbi:MAG: hypothetical protein RIS35_346 [Pseudomonadota bacterium]|jgi:hypothetical protein